MEKVELEAHGTWEREYWDGGASCYDSVADFTTNPLLPLVRCECCLEKPEVPEMLDVDIEPVGDCLCPVFRYSMWTVDNKSYLCDDCYAAGERLEETK